MLFEPLGERLLAAGIAPWRVRRYLAELDDHLAELIEQEQAVGYDTQEATARARSLLGSDDELAQGWLTDPRLKSLTARAPWLVFVLVPPFALLLAFMVPTLSLVIIGRTFGFVGQHHSFAPQWFQQVTTILIVSIDLLLPALLATLLIGIAARQRLPATWPLAGIIVIALLGMQIHVSFPTPGQDRGSVMLGMLPFAGHGPVVYWQTLPAQWLFMLAPALWVMLARWRPARLSQT